MTTRRKRLVVDSPAAEGVTLYPSRKAWLLVFLVCLAFCAASSIPIARGDWKGWLGLTFFGLGGLVALTLVSFPQISSLRLTVDGFYTKSLFRTHFTRWQDVSYFSVASISMNAMVVFNYSSSYNGQKFGRKLAHDLAGWEGALSDTYGMSAQELADLMNGWKRRNDGDMNTAVTKA